MFVFRSILQNFTNNLIFFIEEQCLKLNQSCPCLSLKKNSFSVFFNKKQTSTLCDILWGRGWEKRQTVSCQMQSKIFNFRNVRNIKLLPKIYSSLDPVREDEMKVIKPGVYLFIYFVCLSVCLYPIKIKTAEPIGPYLA